MTGETFGRLSRSVDGRVTGLYSTFDFLTNLRTVPLMQWRIPVGGGPSSKAWPRCPSQRAQRTSTRRMP